MAENSQAGAAAPVNVPSAEEQRKIVNETVAAIKEMYPNDYMVEQGVSAFFANPQIATAIACSPELRADLLKAAKKDPKMFTDPDLRTKIIKELGTPNKNKDYYNAHPTDGYNAYVEERERLAKEDKQSMQAFIHTMKAAGGAYGPEAQKSAIGDMGTFLAGMVGGKWGGGFAMVTNILSATTGKDWLSSMLPSSSENSQTTSPTASSSPTLKALAGEPQVPTDGEVGAARLNPYTGSRGGPSQGRGGSVRT